VTRKSGALTLFGVFVAATLGATTARDTDLAGPAPRAGTIAGTVTLEPPPPPRRTADRYGGGASNVQRLPAVVYLKGAVAGSAPAGYVANPEITQRDTAFAPSTVALRVGGTVSFPNRDPFFHNVFSYSSANRFDLGRYPEGESKQVVFDEPGVVEVFCEVHDFMRGAIVVTENPYHAVVADDGTFAIEGVPAGEYTLVAWHADHREVERSVTVTDGGVVRLEVELRR
jgi:plastocyanin